MSSGHKRAAAHMKSQWLGQHAQVPSKLMHKPKQAQTRQIQRMESAGGHEVPPLAGELLETDASFWHRDKSVVFKSVALVC